MNNIELEFIERLATINNWVTSGQLTRHSTLAVMLEDLTIDIWNKAKELGETTWEEAEDLQPSLRIDP